jgi:uncharacterized membrane protein YdjX (TVP38/TMEM64 family)
MALSRPLRLVLVTLAVLLMLMGMIYLSRYATLANLKEHRSQMLAFTAHHQTASLLLYALFYTIVASFAFPGILVCTIAGGFLFGVIKTTLIVMAAATIGATLTFLTTRLYFSQKLEQQLIKRFGWIYRELQRYGAYYLLILRFLPILPFFVVNILAGLAPLSLSNFLLVTVIGMIPPTLVYAYAGTQLATLQSMHDLLTARFLLGACALLLLILLPLLISRRRTPPSAA